MSQKYSKKQSHKHKRSNRLIPLLFGLGGIALLALAGLAVWGGGSQPKAAIEVNGAPSLKVDKEKIDLGNITLGKTVQVTFRLTNVGDQPLRFSQAPYIEVKEGC